MNAKQNMKLKLKLIAILIIVLFSFSFISLAGANGVVPQMNFAGWTVVRLNKIGVRGEFLLDAVAKKIAPWSIALGSFGLHGNIAKSVGSPSQLFITPDKVNPILASLGFKNEIMTERMDLNLVKRSIFQEIFDVLDLLRKSGADIDQLTYACLSIWDIILSTQSWIVGHSIFPKGTGLIPGSNNFEAIVILTNLFENLTDPNSFSDLGFINTENSPFNTLSRIVERIKSVMRKDHEGGFSELSEIEQNIYRLNKMVLRDLLDFAMVYYWLLEETERQFYSDAVRNLMRNYFKIRRRIDVVLVYEAEHEKMDPLKVFGNYTPGGIRFAHADRSQISNGTKPLYATCGSSGHSGPTSLMDAFWEWFPF